MSCWSGIKAAGRQINTLIRLKNEIVLAASNNKSQTFWKRVKRLSLKNSFFFIIKDQSTTSVIVKDYCRGHFFIWTPSNFKTNWLIDWLWLLTTKDKNSSVSITKHCYHFLNSHLCLVKFWFNFVWLKLRVRDVNSFSKCNSLGLIKNLLNGLSWLQIKCLSDCLTVWNLSDVEIQHLLTAVRQR